jgi:hypothetical protein
MEKRVDFTVSFWVDSKEDVPEAMNLIAETRKLPESTYYISNPIVDGIPLYDEWGN